MTKPDIIRVKVVKDSSGGLMKPILGQIIDGFECEGTLFETEEDAENHLAHLPLRDKLQAAMFTMVVNTGWFEDDDDEAMEQLAERLSLAMLGVFDEVDEERDTIIDVLTQDRELYK